MKKHSFRDFLKIYEKYTGTPSYLQQCVREFGSPGWRIVLFINLCTITNSLKRLYKKPDRQRLLPRTRKPLSAFISAGPAAFWLAAYRTMKENPRHESEFSTQSETDVRHKVQSVFIYFLHSGMTF
jgi:hypothetical protein